MSEPQIHPAPAFLQRLAARWRGKALQVLCLFLFFFAAGLFTIAKCPPLWRDYDGLIQISNRPGDMTVLQYPVAYPLFSRLHVWAAQIIQGKIHHKKTSIRIRKPVTLNDAGIEALMLSQQLTMALALTAFVRTCARSRRAQWAIAILLVSNASLFVTANLVSSEALTQILAVAFVALSFRLFQSEKLPRGGVAAYGLCLYISILTRHPNAVFAMLPPMAYIFRAAWSWMRERGGLLVFWKPTAIFMAVGFACIGASDLTTHLACRAFNVPYRSISARAASERLGFADRLPPQEREAFLADLQKRAADPVVREAIPALAHPATWVEQRRKIQAILLRDSPGLTDEAMTLRSEACLDHAVGLFFRSGNHRLVEETFDSIWRSFAATSSYSVSYYYLRVGEWSIILYASDPGMSKKTHGLAVCSIAAKDKITAFEANPWLKLWIWAPHGAILLASSIVALVFLFRKIGDPRGPLFVLAIVFTGVVVTCLTFVVVNYIPRFTSVTDLFGFLALAVVVAHGIDAYCAASPNP